MSITKDAPKLIFGVCHYSKSFIYGTLNKVLKKCQIYESEILTASKVLFSKTAVKLAALFLSYLYTKKVKKIKA